MDVRNNYAIIMAGGVGSRFWPVSTSKHPKQFLDILGTGKSLLRQTFERFAKIIPQENIYIVTNHQYISLVRENIPEIGIDQILGEPSAKNTAPCIALATYKIYKQNPLANFVVAPSDHLILQEQDFLNIVNNAMAFSAQHNSLHCIGIKPHRPDTGYGYIQFIEKSSTDDIFKVKTFTEKPSLEIAQTFVESGDFLWNAGIFIWNAEAIMEAFEKHLPEVSALFREIYDDLNTSREMDAITSTYQMCTNVSIDYGVLEKAENVYVHPGEFGWSDLGTWASLYDVFDKDAGGNAVNGKMVQMYDSSNCMVCVPDDKLVVVKGVNNLIIVESDKALLVCDKSLEQEIKQLVTDVKLKYGDKFS